MSLPQVCHIILKKNVIFFKCNNVAAETFISILCWNVKTKPEIGPIGGKGRNDTDFYLQD